MVLIKRFFEKTELNQFCSKFNSQINWRFKYKVLKRKWLSLSLMNFSFIRNRSSLFKIQIKVLIKVLIKILNWLLNQFWSKSRISSDQKCGSKFFEKVLWIDWVESILIKSLIKVLNWLLNQFWSKRFFKKSDQKCRSKFWSKVQFQIFDENDLIVYFCSQFFEKSGSNNLMNEFDSNLCS